MAEDPNKNTNSPKTEALDLDALSGLDFGPDWAGERGQKRSSQKSSSREHASAKRKNASSRDRRAGGGPRDHRGSQQETKGGRRQPRRGERDRERPFQPTVKVDLYPQDEAFDALIARLRSSARTYQLFDIAQLLLEKAERFVVVVSPKSEGSEAPTLYYSVPGHLPFETEDAAIAYVMAHHLDQFFDIESIEVEPPKGNFLMVNRCTITGALIGPPNYHRYQEFLNRHYATRITGMSYDRFLTKIEGVKEQEYIDAWIESMKQGARYTLKERKDSEPESFDTLEAARTFLLQNRREAIVGSGPSVRFAGRDIERLPPGNIRRSVEAYVESQRQFPLDSANNIRGRLRRHKFAVYKKGSKGVSFVCAVKRKFREEGTVFTDSIRDLIDFIEQHPEIPASRLPREYIGIDTERQKPETLKMTEAEVAAAAEAKRAGDGQSKDTAPANDDSPTPADAVSKGPEVAAQETAEEGSGGAKGVSEAPKPLADGARASTEATPKAELSADEAARLRQLMLDLRWLITEGYVTEYGDGRLYAPPPLPRPKPKVERAKDAPMEPAPSKESAQTSAESNTERFQEGRNAAPSDDSADSDAGEPKA